MSDVRLTHVGGPTVRLEVGVWRLLTDPTFDSPGRSYRFGWGTGSRKLAGPAIPPPSSRRLTPCCSATTTTTTTSTPPGARFSRRRA